MSKLFDSTIQGLEKSLELRMKRHAVLTSNIANNQTPKFLARELDFSGALAKAMDEDHIGLARTHPGHTDISELRGPHIIHDTSMPIKADGNSVDLDISMGKMAENSRAYSNAVNMLEMKLRMLKTFASGRAGA